MSGGIVALDPHTGRVLAEAGGFSFAISQFDRVTQARRQTGSAIKPFVYLAAVDHGFTPSTLVLDGPLVVDQGPGLPKWNPTNYEHKFYGPVPLRVGLEESLNLVTARVGLAVGVDTVGQYLKRFGITDNVPQEDAMLIGAEDTTLLRLTAAYAMLDNGGKRIAPTFIDRVQDRNGHDHLPRRRPAVRRLQRARLGRRAAARPARYARADRRSEERLPGRVDDGRGGAARHRPLDRTARPPARRQDRNHEQVRTTPGSSDSRPISCAAYSWASTSRRASASARPGRPSPRPPSRSSWRAALKDKPAIPFRIPPGLDIVRVNATTGQLARGGDRSAIYEPFKPGTEPKAEDAGVVLNGSSDALPAAAGAVPAAASAPAPEEGDMPQSASPAGGTGGLY